MLQRLEADHETEKGVFKKFLMFLWGSRRGLYLETELALLMEERKIEHHEYSAIYIVLEELLFSSSGTYIFQVEFQVEYFVGLLNFTNRDIRKAVENKYITSPEIRKEIHNSLATFFRVTRFLRYYKIFNRK